MSRGECAALHVGQTYGYASVVGLVGRIEYEVRTLCCGRTVTMDTRQINRLNREKPKQCKHCVQANFNRASLTPEELAAGGNGHVMAEQRERLGLIEARELARAQMMERVAHARAQADAALAAAHERQFGRPPTGRPDFQSPLFV